MRNMIIVAALLSALPLSAQARMHKRVRAPMPKQPPTVQQTFLKFGLIGIWARACDQPANMAAGNSRAIYALSGHDGVMVTYENGPKHLPTVYTVLSAEKTGPHRLTYVEQRFNTQERATVTVRKIGGRIGVQTSVREDGKVLVQDGRFTANGRTEPQQSRCQG